MDAPVVTLILAAIVLGAIVVTGLVRGGYPFRGVLRRIVSARPRRSRANDQEFRDRRHELLERVTRQLLDIPAAPPGEMLHVVVRINPADDDLVGRDAISDDQEIGRLLRAGGRGDRVTIRGVRPDGDIPRGRADVIPVARPGAVRPTRGIDDAGEATRGARLVRLGSNDEIAIPPAGGVIGRDVDLCQVVVDAPTVSRRHAHLRPRSNGFTVEDLGSANGLMINSRRTERGQLQHGDVLSLGKVVRLRLEVRDR